MQLCKNFISLACFLFICGSPAIGQGDQEKAEKQKEEKPVKLKDNITRAEHRVQINGQTIEYEAITGTLVMRDEKEKDKSSIFFVYYTKKDENPEERPITFTFNGGPGSSSVWLHLGAFGPKRVLMDDEGFQLPPPNQLVENEYSLLDITDLVFIDPVTTGFSRAAPNEDPSQFHGVTEDVESVGDFIRLFLARYNRWASPKFLAGESYGTTRAAGLSGYLQRRRGIFLNGIVLVSSVLNFQTLEFDTGNDLPYLVFLPTYTATAWYHQRLDDNLQQDLRTTLEEVEQFALGEYSLALMKGSELGESEREAIVAKLARYTSLSEDYIRMTNLRIHDGRFFKELLREEGKTTGRLDSRFTGVDSDSAGERIEFDPSMAAIWGPYTAMLNDYIRRELGFEIDLPYEVMTGRVHPWKFGPAENRYLNVAETLRRSITYNKNLKIFVANGYYDLATPYFATEYTFSHLGLDSDLQANITMAYYEAGHMMYIRLESLAKLKRDLVDFYSSALR
jgi:carboxypeptidase C (cathepsin A)